MVPYPGNPETHWRSQASAKGQRVFERGREACVNKVKRVSFKTEARENEGLCFSRYPANSLGIFISAVTLNTNFNTGCQSHAF